MKAVYFFVIFFALSTLMANPIIVFEDGTTYYGATKREESCIAAVGKDHSQVSCRINYRLKELNDDVKSSYHLVALPVYLPHKANVEPEKLLELISPRVEADGIVVKPYSQSLVESEYQRGRYTIPPSADLYFFLFRLQVGKNRRELDLLVTYSQPIIDGHFYYLPMFEDGKSNKRHVIDIVSSESGIALEPVGDAYTWEQFSTRLETRLQHEQLIEILVKEE